MDKEVVVIGAGPAGLSAAIYLGRAKIDTLLIGKFKESQVMKAHLILNYLGFPEGIAGKELLEKARKQVQKYKVPILEKEVVNITKKDNIFTIKIDDGKIVQTKAVILATGTPIKLSGIEREEDLVGKGIHYCVECDGPLYQKKNIAVIGSGNHAAEEALSLLPYTKQIIIISHDSKFTFSKKFEQAIKDSKIQLLNEKVKGFEGKNAFESLTLMNGKKLRFDAVFMGCGELSALDFASKLALKIENDGLVVDKYGMTTEQGIFAAGNCISKCRQVAKSVGDGCNAALSAIKFVRNTKVYQDYAT